MALEEPGLTATETIDGDPVYKVFVLGARGAGKTVFLSALYSHLRVANQVNRFAVEVSQDDKLVLQSYCDCLCNPELAWPSGTGAVTDFEFQCVYRRENTRSPLFRMRYKDYPGAYVTQGQVGDDFDAGLETRTAHSILVLLDGRKIFEKLEGYRPDGETLESDLNSIIPLLEYSAHKPIHFLVTKWDILRGLHSFSAVKDVLFECEAFANFIKGRQDAPIRLVPVSAVGNDFAKFDFRSREMIKLQRKGIRPYNVDLSIVLTLMDQVCALGRAAIVHKIIPYWMIRFLKGSTWLSKLLLSCLRLDEWQFPFLPKIHLAPILRALTSAEEGLASLEEKLGKRVDRARSDRDVAQAIYELQAYRMLKFVREFPESGLTEATNAWIPNSGHSSSPQTSSWTTA